MCFILILPLQRIQGFYSCKKYLYSYKSGFWIQQDLSTILLRRIIEFVENKILQLLKVLRKKFEKQIIIIIMDFNYLVPLLRKAFPIVFIFWKKCRSCTVRNSNSILFNWKCTKYFVCLRAVIGKLSLDTKKVFFKFSYTYK